MLATEEMDGGGEGLVVAGEESAVSAVLTNCTIIYLECSFSCSLTWCSTVI